MGITLALVGHADSAGDLSGRVVVKAFLVAAPMVQIWETAQCI